MGNQSNVARCGSGHRPRQQREQREQKQLCKYAGKIGQAREQLQLRLLLFCACGQQLHVHVLLSDLIYRYVIDWCLAQQMHAGVLRSALACTASISCAIVGTFCYRLVIEAVISCEIIYLH